MNKVWKMIKKNWFYIVAFVMPWGIALLHSLIADTWVTGNGNIAMGDLQAQIIPICYEFWDKIHAGESLLYTWHIAGGTDFNALAGYLFSPFTLIMLLFPRHCIPDYMQFTMLMKWSLSAFTMVYFFYNTKHNTLTTNKKAVSLFLGLAYALGNGVMSYMLYVQFMDVLICFPILLLLVEKMVEQKKWKIYYLLLTFCIMCNSYIAYQVCLFLVIWYFMQMRSTVGEKLKKFFLFAGSSVLSAITASGGILVGILLSNGRLQSEGVTSRADYLDGALISFTDFVKQLFVFEPISEANQYTPNIYFSVFAVLLVLLFPFIRISKKRKIYMLLIAVLMIASFFSGPLSLVWHLFNVPNGVYHRFMYLFVFYMLFILLYVLEHLQDIRWQYIVITMTVAAIAGVYTFFHIESYDSYIVYFATAMLFVFLMLIMMLYCRKSITYKQILTAIVVCGILELGVNAYSAFRFYDAELYFGNGGFMDDACELLEKADLKKGERIVTSNPTPDIGLMTGQNTDAGFLSSINVANKTLHENLGMGSNSSVEFESRGASPLVNLIFNIRYGHGESEMLFSDATLVDQDDFLQLYRMERLAGLGYMVDETVKDWSSENKNCFQYQNDFVHKAVGGDDIFHTVDADVKCADIFGKEYEQNPDYAKEGAYLYDIENQYGNEFDSLQVDFTATEDMDLYMYFWSKDNYDLNIFIDGEEKHKDIRPFLQSSYHIGKVKKGQRVAICMIPAQNFTIGEHSQFMFVLGQFDEKAYAEVYEKLSKNVYDIEVEESDYIKGTIHAEESGIMMTSIQAAEGFKVYVDGKQVSYETIGGALIGVPLEAGDHVVEFRYETMSSAIIWGIFSGGFSVFLIICMVGWLRRKKQKDMNVMIEQEG